MAARSAWVLNLDADVELASLAVAGYTPSAAARRAMAPHVERLAASLVGPDDVRVDESSAVGAAAGLVGHAFCPTPRAIALLERAGALPAPHPPVSVLRLVNGRAFCASLGETLPDAIFATSMSDAVRRIATAPCVGRQWRAKRAFGMAGRGQRPIAVGAPSEGDHAFLSAAISKDGGLMIEPDVDIVCELAVHGMVHANGGRELGVVVEQICDVHGQWQESRPATGIADDVRGALESEASRVASALAGAGYFGPFGIDAFLYRDREGRVRLQPRSEINARYSMGFAVGFGRAV